MYCGKNCTFLSFCTLCRDSRSLSWIEEISPFPADKTCQKELRCIPDSSLLRFPSLPKEIYWLHNAQQYSLLRIGQVVWWWGKILIEAARTKKGINWNPLSKKYVFASQSKQTETRRLDFSLKLKVPSSVIFQSSLKPIVQICKIAWGFCANNWWLLDIYHCCVSKLRRKSAEFEYQAVTSRPFFASSPE